MGLNASKLSFFVLCMIIGTQESAVAQIGNSGEAVGAASGAGSVQGVPENTGSAIDPSGPGLSRLPLTTLDVMPLEGTSRALSTSEVPGISDVAGVEGQAHGSAAEKWPYSTARVAITGAPFSGASHQNQIPVSSRPYRWIGKLRMRFGTTWYNCTASLIKKGVLVTAAHCVHNYGEQAAGWADEVRWYPANWAAGGGPWGYFQAQNFRVPTPYFNGNDTCQAGAIGIVCNNDIATVMLAPRNGRHAGAILGGWFNYGWNGYGFVASPAFGNHQINALTQFGYPLAIDSGYQMIRNDSLGKYIQSTGANGKVLKNAQLGSAMTGGSSGGPWITNFGTRPNITGGASLGSFSNSNIITGVTSWGYTSVGVNVQGASWFGQVAEYPNSNYGGHGAGNIGSLVNDTCGSAPSHC